jgi:bile acid:Na+ symporter, BASS family
MASWLPDLIGMIVPVTVGLVAFEVGMTSAAAEVTELLRRRGLLLRSLLGTLVVVPLLAVVLVRGLALPNAVSTGLLVTAISVGPVAALEKSQAKGAARRFALRLNIVLLALSLLFVPFTIWVIGAAFQREAYLSVADVARVILPLQLFPLLAGLAVGRLAPSFATRAGGLLAAATNLILGAVLVLVLVTFLGPLLALGWRVLAVLATLGSSCMLVAHLLGGPEATDRRVLASFMALRFPTLALALAELSVHGRDAVPTVVGYLFCSGIAYSLYSAALGHFERHARPPTDSRPRSLPAS